MRKQGLAVLCTLLVSVFSFSNEQKAIDLVVVLDTSSSMYVHYKEVSDYVIGPLLKDFLRYGDTFHLISFSSVAKTEISRKIEGIGDIETIIGRLLLLYPLDNYSDIVAALQYAGRYLADLPENRAKTVIFITDGDHSPGPTSPYKDLSKENLEKAISDAAGKLKGNGWIFHYVRVPQDLNFRSTELRMATSDNDTEETANSISALPQSGTDKTGQTAVSSNTVNATESAKETQDVSTIVAQELNVPVTELNPEQGSEIISTAIGAISVDFPISVGKVTRDFSIPIRVKNPSPHSVYLETQAILVDGVDRLKKKSFKELLPRSDSEFNLYISLPESYQPGTITLNIEPQFTGSIRINPPSASIRADIVNNTISSWLLKLLPLLLLAGGILLAAILAGVIIIVLRRLQNNPGIVMAEAMQRTQERPAIADSAGRLSPENKTGRSVHTNTSTADLMAEFAKEKKDSVKIPAISPVFATLQEDGTSSLPARPSLSVEPNLSIRQATGRIMLNLFVQDQNTAIGKRNVHLMKAGHRLTVGGHNSDFLIFLVPIPHRIADVHFDGEQLTLIPKRPEFFPETGAEPIYNCVGKTIHLRSAKGYDLYIRFDKYQDPLEALNSFLRSIETTG